MTKPLKNFIRLEAVSGVLLFACAAVALIWANSPIRETYFGLWHIGIAGVSLHHWINDGLMSVFFLLVGLEIKREILGGDLSSRGRASLPIAAAAGGMILPAIVYAFINQGSEGARGWGIPMATDIAFAMGVLALLGKRVPSSLKIFLMALAIVDDVGAVLVIALFYTSQISRIDLILGLGIFGVLVALNRTGFTKAVLYLALGVISWFTFLRSGIHATIAGVLLAFVIPAKTGERIEHRLHPWVSYGIMPIFALANAGVSLRGGALLHPVSVGIIAGLVLGKQIGITFFSWLAIRLKLATLPTGVGFGHIYGAAWLGGIGFTMSLFIANLAFVESALTSVAKTGILLASVISGAGGAALLWNRRAEPR